MFSWSFPILFKHFAPGGGGGAGLLASSAEPLVAPARAARRSARCSVKPRSAEPWGSAAADVRPPRELCFTEAGGRVGLKEKMDSKTVLAFLDV